METAYYRCELPASETILPGNDMFHVPAQYNIIEASGTMCRGITRSTVPVKQVSVNGGYVYQNGRGSYLYKKARKSLGAQYAADPGKVPVNGNIMRVVGTSTIEDDGIFMDPGVFGQAAAAVPEAAQAALRQLQVGGVDIPDPLGAPHIGLIAGHAGIMEAQPDSPINVPEPLDSPLEAPPAFDVPAVAAAAAPAAVDENGDVEMALPEVLTEDNAAALSVEEQRLVIYNQTNQISVMHKNYHDMRQQINNYFTQNDSEAMQALNAKFKAFEEQNTIDRDAIKAFLQQVHRQQVQYNEGQLVHTSQLVAYYAEAFVRWVASMRRSMQQIQAGEGSSSRAERPAKALKAIAQPPRLKLPPQVEQQLPSAVRRRRRNSMEITLDEAADRPPSWKSENGKRRKIA